MGTPNVIGDAVLVQTTTTGTGTYSLGAAITGHLTFAQAGIPSGSRVCCTVVDSLTAPTQREVFEGVYTSGSPATVTRALIVRNSSGTQTAINWGSGTKYLFVSPNASRIPLLDTDGLLRNSVVPQQLITHLYTSSTVTIPNVTATTVAWDRVGANTLAGVSGSGSSYTTITLPSDGVYSVQAAMQWLSNTSGGRTLGIGLGGQYLDFDQKTAATTGQVNLRCMWRGSLTAGSVISAVVGQDSGGALAVGGNLTVVRL